MTIKYRGGLAVEYKVAAAALLTSSNSYVDLYTWSVAYFKTKQIQFTAATNNLHFKVLGSIDGGLTFPTTVEAEFTVNAAASTIKSWTGIYTHLKAQIQPAVASTHGTGTIDILGVSY